MGYYGMGDYYRSARGDYYRGDPFLGALLGGAVRVGGALVKRGIQALAKRPISTAVATAPIIAPIVRGAGGLLPQGPAGGSPIQIGKVGVNPSAILPGGKPFLTYGSRSYRRMNPANPKALRRAIRREQAFVKLARRALKGTGLTISRKGVARRKVGRR